MFASLRRYLISGLLVWIPIWVTFLLLRFFVKLLNGAYESLPVQFKLVNLIGVDIPGVGIIITLILLLVTGVFAANLLGKKMVSMWDRFIARIPLVSSIYSAVKQVMDSMLSSKGKAFRKVLLVEYPRKGLWSIAFQTGSGGEKANAVIGDPDVVTIFIPTTPNPTSGFLMMVPRKDVHELDMTVDQALKFVISLGVVQPGDASLNAKG